MNESTVLQLIAKVIGERLMIDPDLISRETSAEDVNGWDSVTHTLIVMAVEDELGITFDMDDIFELESVGDFVDLVERSRGNP